MKILLVNDDGYNAPGIMAMVDALAKKQKHEVYMVAPAEHMSAKSHALTFLKPITFEEIQVEGLKKAYKLYGTPVDCMKFALHHILKDISFELVISGINNGLNVDNDVNYSGTFAAAHEAATNGINALALSLQNNEWAGRTPEDFRMAAEFVADFIEEIPHVRTPYFYNMNFPEAVDKIELRVAMNLSNGFIYEKIEKISSGGYCYTNTSNLRPIPGGSEYHYILNKKATIVPIRVDYNDYENMLKLRYELLSDTKTIDKDKRQR